MNDDRDGRETSAEHIAEHRQTAHDRQSKSPGEWAFGIHAVQALLKTDARQINELRFLRGRKDQRQQKLQALADTQGIPWQWASRKELDQLADGNHQGVAALCRASTTGIADESALETLLARLAEPPLLLILDEVTDPHNLGACLRTADAVGVHAVITTRDRSAGITPVVRKVASGAAESVPFIVVTNLVRTMERLKDSGIWVMGTDDSAADVLYDVDMTGPLALVMGAEGRGLRRLTRESCDRLIKLPMQGVVSSLNVSVAAGVCLYEISRQRHYVNRTA